ncbi:protein CASC3-like isoform X2 [Argiope bruennichi]|uniref:protein CASC3-like isoform X2 n=1 Tax=Argiope bruennichi TaxID=94029 RepID=UPI0024946234|nr:protein CASC3-like isoform X2 [Argiope bruennichi]
MEDRHRRRRVKSDDDSERSFSESDVEGDDANEAENSPLETPEKSVRRRRRKIATDESDELSFSDQDSEDDAKLILNRKGNTLVKVAEDSEYESTEEEKAANETNKEPKDQESLSEIVDEEGGEEGIAESEDVEGDFLSGDANDDASEEEEEEEEEGEYVEEERQQGDGEECSPSNTATEKELDYDEDRRNPQYIPKKGMFYEHDDRNNEDIKEKEPEPVRDRKKKLWLDEGKWGHDRFREEEQHPKSRTELIETYGYDIRNEDGPPRARRRRRYGRGPTKYDRNWEDVTAYGREKFRGSPRGNSRGRRASGRFRGGPGFRGRGRRDSNANSPRENEAEDLSANEEVPTKQESEDAEVNNAPVINSNEFPALPSKEASETPEETVPQQNYFNKNSSNISEAKSVRTLTFENSNYSNRNSVERENTPRRGKTPPFSANHERGSRKPTPRVGRGSGRGEHSNRRGRGGMRHISPRFMENKMNNLNVDMEQLSLENNDTSNNVNPEPAQPSESNGVLPSTVNSSEVSNMALKGAGDSSGRPKRYSSLRQRSLPETTTYQTPPPTVPPPHPSYYETGYQTTLYAPTETCVPTPSTQSQTVTTTPIMNPSAYQTFTPPPYTDNYGLRMPVTPPPRLFPQVSVPAPQPLLPPPPCITPAANIMSFAPAPPPASYHQFAYQQYAPAPPPPPPAAPPSDIYTAPPAGITYYYPQNQPPTVRPTVQKRPKAAIPILPPPERETKRNDKKDSNQSNNRNFSENSNDPAGVDVSLRTEASSQLQPAVGVES